MKQTLPPQNPKHYEIRPLDEQDLPVQEERIDRNMQKQGD